MMAPRSISFKDEYLWKSSVNNSSKRPYSRVIFSYCMVPYPVWCVVDTAADYLQVKEDVAHHIGLKLSQMPKKTMGLADGSKTEFRFAGDVEVKIEGEKVKVDILFGKNCPALLGRTAFLKAITVAVDNSGWLYAT